MNIVWEKSGRKIFLAGDLLCDLYNLINQLEDNFSTDIAEKNFIPNLIVHEFESLLFLIIRLVFILLIFINYSRILDSLYF